MARIHIILGAMAMIASSPAAAAPADGGALKAAIVFNLLRFTSFPGQGGVELCVQGNDGAAQALLDLDGRALGSGPLAVRRAAPGDLAGCQAVYVGDGPPPRGAAPIAIGNGRGFADQGGAVALVSFGRQVRFVINPAAAARANVSFSSRLLRLALAVKD
jgi:hypothetical protein